MVRTFTNISVLPVQVGSKDTGSSHPSAERWSGGERKPSSLL